MPVTLLSGRPSSSLQTRADHPESLVAAEMCDASAANPATSTGRVRDILCGIRNDHIRLSGDPQGVETIFSGIGNFADYHLIQHWLS
jgi:hypothetical protein